MLNIYYGDMPNAITTPATYFLNRYEEEWIVDPLSKEMILDIDKSEVVAPRIIFSPVLGAITPREISGGVKTLILINKDRNHVFNASACGDNCAKWLLKMGKTEDITINLRHLMDFGDGEFDIKVLNTGDIVHNSWDLLMIAGEIVG